MVFVMLKTGKIVFLVPSSNGFNSLIFCVIGASLRFVTTASIVGKNLFSFGYLD